MAAKSKRQWNREQAAAIDAMRVMGSSRDEAEDHVGALPEHLLFDDLVKHALIRRQTLKEGKKWTPPADLTQHAPTETPAGEPLPPPNRVPLAHVMAQLGLSGTGTYTPLNPHPDSPLGKLYARLGGSKRGGAAPIQQPSSAPTQPTLMGRMIGSMRPLPIPGAPAAAASQPPQAPPVPSQQQSIPGFAPPGGPGAAPQPGAQQAPVMPPAAPITQPSPPLGPPAAPIKPRIRVRAGGAREPAASAASAPPAEPSAYRGLPKISTQEEFNQLKSGQLFIDSGDNNVYRKD